MFFWIEGSKAFISRVFLKNILRRLDETLRLYFWIGLFLFLISTSLLFLPGYKTPNYLGDAHPSHPDLRTIVLSRLLTNCRPVGSRKGSFERVSKEKLGGAFTAQEGRKPSGKQNRPEGMRQGLWVWESEVSQTYSMQFFIVPQLLLILQYR